MTDKVERRNSTLPFALVRRRTFYGLNSAPGTPPPTFLVTIDPATGAVTNLGGSVAAIDAIAFQIPETSVAGMVTAGIAGVLLRWRR